MKANARINLTSYNSQLALAGLVLALLTSAACNRSNAQAAPPAMPPPLVTVVKATAQDVPRYLTEIGRNAARRLAQHLLAEP